AGSVSTQLAATGKKASEAIKGMAGALEKVAESSFSSLGETIANDFNGQNFDIVSGIIGVLGDQLKALGQYLIEVGITKEAIEASLEGLVLPGGCAGAVFASTAAIALGQVRKNAAH